MTNSEINEFLGSWDAKQELVEKLETLQKTLEHAMQPLFEPKYKEDKDIHDMYMDENYWAGEFVKSVIKENEFDLSPVERAIMSTLIAQYFVVEAGQVVEFSIKGLAKVTGWSTTTIKRALKKIIKTPFVRRDDEKAGVYRFSTRC